jgi:hypothetical protein
MVLVLTMELLAVVALLWILAWQLEAHGRLIRRLVVVQWGTTAFSFAHVISEYRIMIRFSRWDPPLGFGYLPVAVITISAILTVIMTLRAPQRVADDGSHRDQHSGSLTLA